MLTMIQIPIQAYQFFFLANSVVLQLQDGLKISCSLGEIFHKLMYEDILFSLYSQRARFGELTL